MKTAIFLFLMIGTIMPAAFAQTAKEKVSSAEIRKQNADHSKVQYGTASYYHEKFHGRKTSSGEIYDKEKFTAAHNGLPMNTWIKVTNLSNRRSVIVKVNDRLHHKNKRVVDLSASAARKLGYIKRGLTRVKVEVLNEADAEQEMNEQISKGDRRQR